MHAIQREAQSPDMPAFCKLTIGVDSIFARAWAADSPYAADPPPPILAYHGARLGEGARCPDAIRGHSEMNSAGATHGLGQWRDFEPRAKPESSSRLPNDRMTNLPVAAYLSQWTRVQRSNTIHALAAWTASRQSSPAAWNTNPVPSGPSLPIKWGATGRDRRTAVRQVTARKLGKYHSVLR
jgi:hypothetical protein